MKPLKDCHILVTPTSYGSMDDRLKTKLEAEVAQVTYNTTGKPLTSSQLQQQLPGVDGMIAGLDEINEEALGSADALKVIARYGVGLNNVDLQAASERGIVVTNTPGANSAAVAELTVALILNLLRPVIEGAVQTKSGEWPRLKGYSLAGRTVGLLGLGAIGKEVARRLAGFDCQLQAYDVQIDEAFAAEHGLEYVAEAVLIESSDVLSLHVPSTPQTRGLVNADFIARMKPGAWLVNTARGDLVDEAALAAALESGQLSGAALDVFKLEPPAEDNPLRGLSNVIMTPHMAAHADSATNEMGRIALDECLRVLSGLEPKFKVA